MAGYKLEMHAGAQRDLGQVLDWYGEKPGDLGKNFLKQLEQVLRNITQNPLLYPMAETPVHRALA